MSRFRISLNGHEIEIRASYWNGGETVTFDGVVVSRKTSWQSLTAHGFEVVEKSGERSVYEVDILGGLKMGFILRRNGVFVAASPRNEIQDREFGLQSSNELWSRVGGGR
jgi:hypothetical protein